MQARGVGRLRAPQRAALGCVEAGTERGPRAVHSRGALLNCCPPAWTIPHESCRPSPLHITAVAARITSGAWLGPDEQMAVVPARRGSLPLFARQVITQEGSSEAKRPTRNAPISGLHDTRIRCRFRNSSEAVIKPQCLIKIVSVTII